LTARGKLLCMLVLLVTAISPASADRYSTLAGQIEALNGSRFARVARIGESVQGRPIYAVALAESLSSDKPRVLILCGQHGSERSPCYGMVSLARDLSNTDNPRLRALLDKLVIVIVPVANPDAFVSFARTNSAGLDLNRDWVAASQPETRAVLGLAKQFRPQVVLDLHEWTDSHPWHKDCVEVAGYGVGAGNKLARLLALNASMPAVYYRAQTDSRLAHRYFTRQGICGMLVETSSRWAAEARPMVYRKLVLQTMASLASPEPLVAQQLSALQPNASPQFTAFALPGPKPAPDPRQMAYGIILLASAGFLIVRSIRRRPEESLPDCHAYRLPLTDLVRQNVSVHARVALMQQYRLRPTDRSKAGEGVLKLRAVQKPG